jgi:hypothetical protein
MLLSCYLLVGRHQMHAQTCRSRLVTTPRKGAVLFVMLTFVRMRETLSRQ